MQIQTDFLYATLILPSLFAATLIGEGILKLSQKQSPVVSFVTGSLFLIIVVVSFVWYL